MVERVEWVEAGDASVRVGRLADLFGDGDEVTVFSLEDEDPDEIVVAIGDDMAGEWVVIGGDDKDLGHLLAKANEDFRAMR